MGQKVNPIGIRVNINNNTWDSTWYAARNTYATLLFEDFKIRAFLKKELYQAGISKIQIERLVNKVVININTARPGVVIGKKGADIDNIKKQLAKITSCEIHLNIIEVKRPEVDAVLIAENIAQQLEKRVSFRRALKRAIQTAMKMGAKGIRINCSGRLGGAEIARMEWYREGRVPLHTLRAVIDYGTAEAKTTYGIIGLKVWVYKGEVLNSNEKSEANTI
jgi:small subunit ribosomal protein S3